MTIIDTNNLELAIIGLGYVGLPLAFEFSKKRSVKCFDLNKDRISELKKGEDWTLELSKNEVLQMPPENFVTELGDLRTCNCFIIAVPTPIDSHNKPDLSAIKNATQAVGTIIKSGDLIIYESTVYPGLTEEVCAPILEKASGLLYSQNCDNDHGVFHLGYSPERVNPGDPDRRIPDIVKVTAGCNEHIAELTDQLYSEIVKAGTFKATSIKVAEAAKIIENTQRDVNIALINEFAIIFDKLGIGTREVLEAASTKWNFLNFQPGLVGGHCIGVDPYYLTFKSREVDYDPHLILAGRQINDNMPQFFAEKISKKIMEGGVRIQGSNILLMGATFKENCPDTRNSKALHLADIFITMKANVEIFDPWIEEKNHQFETNAPLIKYPRKNHYDCIVLAVPHRKFRDLGVNEIRSFGRKQHQLVDLKYLFHRDETDLET